MEPALAADVEDLGLAAEDVGMIPAWQASFLAREGLIGSPVWSMAWASLSPMRFSKVIVTTIVASTPPAWGSRSMG